MVLLETSQFSNVCTPSFLPPTKKPQKKHLLDTNIQAWLWCTWWRGCRGFCRATGAPAVETEAAAAAAVLVSDSSDRASLPVFQLTPCGASSGPCQRRCGVASFAAPHTDLHVSIAHTVALPPANIRDLFLGFLSFLLLLWTFPPRKKTKRYRLVPSLTTELMGCDLRSGSGLEQLWSDLPHSCWSPRTRGRRREDVLTSALLPGRCLKDPEARSPSPRHLLGRLFPNGEETVSLLQEAWAA